MSRRQHKVGRSTLGPGDRLDWGTPVDLFEELDDELGPFDLDAASYPWNALCDRYYSLWLHCDRSGADIECGWEDAFCQPWHGKVWLNPPYGRTIGDWLERARLEVALGHAELVCCLLPSRTDTRWWHAHVEGPVERGTAKRRFIKGRLTFAGAPSAAPFPSVLVIYHAVEPRLAGEELF